MTADEAWEISQANKDARWKSELEEMLQLISVAAHMGDEDLHMEFKRLDYKVLDALRDKKYKVENTSSWINISWKKDEKDVNLSK